MNIQLALDRLTVEQAIAVAKPVSGYVDWIEIGTSLIKEFGMESVQSLRSAFPDHILVADMKTFDNAVYEFNMCFSAGADIATVMGAASMVSIEACMNTAAKSGKQVMIDLLQTSDHQLEQLLVYTDAVFCFHVSKDQQELQGERHAKDGIYIPQALLDGKERKLAFAGGITVDSLQSIALANPHVIIVGSAITKAGDPVKEARAFHHFSKGRKLL